MRTYTSSNRPSHRIAFSAVLVAHALAATSLLAGDWPTWRHDARRGGATSDPLPTDLHLQWTLPLPPPRAAWPASQLELQYDAGYEPVVAGQLLLVGSNVDDSIAAYDTRTGSEVWRFFTEGPIRFAPAVERDRVYVASDDGYLYCLSLADGSLEWRVRGGPRERRVLGNDRLISSWPLRGGPVVADGRVYFAAGIWPFMGIYLHALDAATGEAVWTNSETGSQFTVHPHGAAAFGSVVPQGYLAVSGDTLVVPGGRSLPALFERETGELRQFDFGGKSSGGYDVIVTPLLASTRGESIRLTDGAELGTVPLAIAGDEVLVGATTTGTFIVRTAKGAIGEAESTTDRRGRRDKKLAYLPERTWQIKPQVSDTLRPLLVASKRVYAAGLDRIYSIPWEIPEGTTVESDSPIEIAPDWSAEVAGEVWTMIAADDRLFVVLKNGQLLCFGADGEPETGHIAGTKQLNDNQDRPIVKEVADLLDSANDPQGYALVAGEIRAELIDELLRQSELHVVVMDDDADRVEAFRRHQVETGLYGVRTSAVFGRPASAGLPPYFANLIVAEYSAAVPEDEVAALCRSLRPYGGTMLVRCPTSQQEPLASLAAAELGSPDVSRNGEWTSVRRTGALPGAGEWTHQYADSANSVVSKDSLVRAPLGLLWFGGPSHDEVLPRHGHGPSPQVAGGRLVIEGPDMLRAVDVYTGRLLWQVSLPGLGKFYDNTSHAPGAGEIGSNYVTLADTIYVIHEDQILALDAATGAELRRFTVPGEGDERPPIGVLYVWDDLLVAAASPVSVDRDRDAKPDSTELAAALEATRYAAASRRLAVFNRHSGELLWQRDAEQAFRHNALAVAAERLFLIDGLSAKQLATLARRGIMPSAPARLMALDARTGEEIWSTTDDVFGTFLNYSVEHDVLLQGGSAYRDRAQDEADRGLVAYRGADGEVLWKDLETRYNGPCLLWRDKIITNGNGGFQIDLLTGEQSGWKFARMYGCNTIVGSEHLLTFRSGAAGYCDLARDSGTGNIGGFRSSCTSNLIVADGVLSAPEYTRTCQCAYQNQTSLALVEMPEGEMWTFRPSSGVTGSEKRVGLNFGAPGDRRAPDGTLWFEYPSVGGPSPGLPVQVEPESASYFRLDAAEFGAASGTGDVGGSTTGVPWVAASGIRGVVRLALTLPELLAPAERYTVRLHFAEPDGAEPGARVFDVRLEDQTVATGLDIAREAGAAKRSVVRELRGVAIEGDLDLELVPAEGAKLAEPILCGVEIVAEGADRSTAPAEREETP